jgi:hypothetical protein
VRGYPHGLGKEVKLRPVKYVEGQTLWASGGLFAGQPSAATTVIQAFSHSNRRGFHPRIFFALALEAPLNFVA